MEALHGRLTAALATTDLGSEPGRRDAGRALVAEVITWEFGPAIREHGEFASMVDAIESSLAREPRLAGRLQQLLGELKLGKARG